MDKTPQEQITELREQMCPPTRSVEYNKALCEKYPFLTWHGDPLYLGYDENKEPDYKYTWEDELPEGWRKAFCPQIWDDLKAILEKHNCLNDYSFAQIKEKFGTVRLYCNGYPKDAFDDIIAWENKYEALSEKVCIDCGKPAKYMTTGWITFICEDCAKERDLESQRKYGCREISIPIERIEEFYSDPKAYWEKYKNEDNQ